MAGKKFPKNVDFAEGFFSQATTTENITAPVATIENSPQKTKSSKPKNLGGRPRKNGLKNEQFTLTMNPETYEKLKIIADRYTRGNFSELINETIKSFCNEKNINLADIIIEPEILDKYKQKQENKLNKK